MSSSASSSSSSSSSSLTTALKKKRGKKRVRAEVGTRGGEEESGKKEGGGGKEETIVQISPCPPRKRRKRQSPATEPLVTPLSPSQPLPQPAQTSQQQEEQKAKLEKIIHLRIKCLATSRSLVEQKWQKWVKKEQSVLEAEETHNRQLIHRARREAALALQHFRTLMNLHASALDREIDHLLSKMGISREEMDMSTLETLTTDATTVEMQLEVHDAAIGQYAQVLDKLLAFGAEAGFMDTICCAMKMNLSQWFNLDLDTQYILAAKKMHQATTTTTMTTKTKQPTEEEQRRTNPADEPLWCDSCASLLVVSDALGGRICENCSSWYPYNTRNANQIAFREAQTQQPMSRSDYSSSNTNFPNLIMKMIGRTGRSRAQRGGGVNTKVSSQQTQTQQRTFPESIIRATKQQIATTEFDASSLTYAQFYLAMKSIKSMVPDISKFYKYGQELYTRVTGKTIPSLTEGQIAELVSMREVLEPIVIQILHERGEHRTNSLNGPYTLSLVSLYLGLFDFEKHVTKMSLQNRLRYDSAAQEAIRRLESMCEMSVWKDDEEVAGCLSHD